MAEGGGGTNVLTNEKYLEDGEIDDLEEGEIEEDFEELPRYTFTAKEEKLGCENGSQTRQSSRLQKSENFTHNQRNSSRTTKAIRDRDERRADAHSPRGYDKANRNRASSKYNFSGKRRNGSVRSDKYRTVRDSTSLRGNEDCILSCLFRFLF